MKPSRNRWALKCGVLTVFLAAVIAGVGPAARAAETEGVFAIAKRLGRGVNVIGYDPLWKDRARARFQPEHFKLIHEAGFTHVRIPLHPFRDAPRGQGDQIGENYLKTMDWVIEQTRANKLMVILDFHEFQAMAKDPAANKARFLTMWGQIAERYKDQADDVVFEILNEPNGTLTPELWNQYLADALAVIRKTNPTRAVIIGPAQWNNINQLDKLVLPEQDRNLIVTVHYYSPFDFTHQGASWAGKGDKIGVPWDGTDKDKAAVTKDFDKAAAWAAKQNRPVYLGEFGAYDKAEMSARVRWTSFVAREAEKRGWAWGYWQFDGDFIVYDINGKKWVEPIRDALIPPPGRNQ
ncbi:MAG: glycoside hydrolase family 5 protein [Tepidisphaerales bacterium]